MNEQEAFAKIAVAALVVVGIIALGYLVVFIILPVFVLAVIIDAFVRQGYNRNLAAITGSPDLVSRPGIHDFDAKLHEGRVVIAWLVDLPGDAWMDIYRLQGSGGGSIDDIHARGECIHTTGVEFTDNIDLVVEDTGLEDGTYYYVPVLNGLVVEKEPLPYSFLGFSTQVQFSHRRNRQRSRGDAVAITVETEVPKALPDPRDDAQRMADEILQEFVGRRKQNADLDAAIERINQSSDLSAQEKQEAIELLEARSVAQ